MNIRTVQNNLVGLGYGSMLAPFGVDGINGTKTKGAVLRFQKDYNKKLKRSILEDGIPGSQTKVAFEVWNKQAGKVGTKNFKISEFNCKGTGRMLSGGMDSKLLLGLEKLRYSLSNNPITITSGYRTPAHNKVVGGASKSQHLYGKAADIKVRNRTPNQVYNAADRIFNGLGKYNTFTHVDVRANKVRF